MEYLVLTALIWEWIFAVILWIMCIFYAEKILRSIFKLLGLKNRMVK